MVENEPSGFFGRFWDWRLSNAPEYATFIGIHKYDHRMDEMNLNAFSRRKDEGTVMLNEAKCLLNNLDLSGEAALNLNLVISDLEQWVHGMQFNPYVWPLNKWEGPDRHFPRLLSWMKKESVADFEKILTRMRLFPQQLYEMILLLKEGIRLGLTMHEVSIEPLPDTLIDLVEVSVTESSMFLPFTKRPQKITDEEWDKLVDEAKTIVEYDIYPSYIRLSNFIRDEYLSYTRQSIAASSLPGGEEYYAACLKFYTTTNLTPKEVHEIGKTEVKRIKQCLARVQDEVGYKGSLKEFRMYMRNDERFNFKTATEIINRYKEVARNISDKLPQYFRSLPKTPFQVTPVPPEVAPGFPSCYYIQPPNDGTRPGTFYVNTNKPQKRKKNEVISLCLHEAVPGHHLQSCLAMESCTYPDFRRFNGIRAYNQTPASFSMYSAYLEGWGLYSEYLGEEMGLYSDPYDMYGRLHYEMIRACRLVVDTGIHAFGWSREQAVKYMEESTASDMHDFTAEIDRCITWPGQACGYKIGELKIKELRKKAECELRDMFDLKMFHHSVACIGGVPLNILEKQIDELIQQQLD